MNTLLLAVDSTGYPSRWLTWQDAIAQDVLGKVAYGFGDYEFTFRGGTNRITGRESSITLKSILVLKGRSPENNRRSTVGLTNVALFRRDQYMCAYCGKVSYKGLTRDHIVPLSRGGRDSWLNCCACCLGCNLRKGAHTLEELGWELLYVPYVPSHQEGLILENRQILADQMELLKAMLPKHSRVMGLRKN
ncbi:MAG: hypothetical protein RJA99_2427 [Pseudomonadota bacterium]|jgi:5-methylcytosine-specific restriction endonuclease McrA